MDRNERLTQIIERAIAEGHPYDLVWEFEHYHHRSHLIRWGQVHLEWREGTKALRLYYPRHTKYGYITHNESFVRGFEQDEIDRFALMLIERHTATLPQPPGSEHWEYTLGPGDRYSKRRSFA